MTTSMERGFGALLVLWGLLLISARARAEPSPEYGTRLSFVRSAGATDCIAAQALEREIVRRMGRDPFSGPPRQWIEGVIDADDGYFTVQLFERDSAGKTLGSRRFRNLAGDCHQLDDAIVLAVALIIDPAAELLPPNAANGLSKPSSDAARAPSESQNPAAASPTTRAVEPSATRPSATAPLARDERSAHSAAAMVTADAVAVHGVLPGLAPGIELVTLLPVDTASHFGLRLSALYLPETRQNTGGEFGYGLTSLEAGACRVLPSDRFRWFGCATLGAGAVHVVVHRPAPLEPGDRLWIALRVEAGLDLHLAGPVWAEMRVFDLIAPRRWKFRVKTDSGEQTAFAQAFLMPGAALGLGLHFN
jgi:hypothetical protein